MSFRLAAWQALHRAVDLLVGWPFGLRCEGQRPVIPTNLELPYLQVLGWGRTWKTDVLRHFYRPQTGPFVDVGANAGQTLLDLMSTGLEFRYVGFEPNPLCAAYLNRLVSMNGLSQSCLIVPAGLHESDCVVPLYLGNSGDPGGTIDPELRPGRSLSTVCVSCYRFDNLPPALFNGGPGFVKIDVEGLEESVLRGMAVTLRKHRPLVLCEVLHADANADRDAHAQRNARIVDLLGELDYSLHHVIPTPDERQLVEIRKTGGFGHEVWGPENKHLCDYLFVPVEREQDLAFTCPR